MGLLHPEKSACLALLALLVVSNEARVQSPADFANLLTGSFTDGQRFSTGNTLPLVGRPWGFNHWAPQTTDGRSSWWFSGSHHEFHWIRCTHQPSPWIGDYAWFMIGPQMGGRTDNPVGFWEPRGAVVKPYVFEATTGPDGMHIELTPSMHGAILRATFPAFNPDAHDKRICMKLDGGDWGSDGRAGQGKFVTGRTTRVQGRPRNFAMHIYAVADDAESVQRDNRMTCFSYGRDHTTAVVRLSTSFISPEQAKISFDREVASVSYEELREEAKKDWNELLGRVDVLDPGLTTSYTEKHLTIFYTGLYRALTFPRKLEEVDANGKVVHYSPYSRDGGVRNGPLVTDNGFWDTYRTVYPLLSLLYPDKLGEIVDGWINAFKEGGQLPKWASPGYRDSMVGTYGDVVLADAIVKQVPHFDVGAAVNALRVDSFYSPGRPSGKDGLDQYNQYHYLPSDGGVSEHVSRALDYAFADSAVARAASKLAQLTSDSQDQERYHRESRELEERSIDVMRKLYDSRTGLMRPKNRRGGFDSAFEPKRWGGGYTEGSAWHHSFPSFNVEELAKIHGSADHLLSKLHELIDTPGTFGVGGYGQVIHEMSEMRAVAMGQYGHNNQPCHHLLYMFALLGDQHTTQKLVRKVMDHAYGEDFYAGDEDNGEMGSWFVLSALGLYSVAPGTEEYVLGSPIFKHVCLHLPALDPFQLSPNGPAVTDGLPSRDIHIVALGTEEHVDQVQQVTWNGETVNAPIVLDSIIQRGGVLQFFMENEDPSSPPFTLSSLQQQMESHQPFALPPPVEKKEVISSAESESVRDEHIDALRSEVDRMAQTNGQLTEDLRVSQDELEREKEETQRLRDTLEAQSREVESLENSVKRRASSAQQGSTDLEGELDALRASLSVELNEHKRTQMMLSMQEEQLKRLESLASSHPALTLPHMPHPDFSAPTNPAFQQLLYGSGILACISLVVLLCVGGGPSRSRKAASHTV